MINEKISSTSALVYHIEMISKSWKFENPYYNSLKSLFHDLIKVDLDINNSKQQYHIIAKIICDEINKNITNIKDNANEIKELIDEYLLNMNQNKGDIILCYLFNIYLLNILDKNTHFIKIEKEMVCNFLKQHQSDNIKYKNYKKILDIIYLNIITKEENIRDYYDLALELLYKRILISNTEYRNEDYLLDYYIKQNEIEKLNINMESEISRGNLLEIALVLKAVNSKGLYIPELEKENYISNYSKEIVSEKYLDVISDITKVNIKNFEIQNWLLFVVIILIELFVATFPDYISIPLGLLEINSSIIHKFNIHIIIVLNGIISLGYIIYLYYKTNKKVKSLKW